MSFAFDTIIVKLNWADPGTGETNEIITPLPLTIGRDSDNKVTINSSLVSRKHASIQFEEGKIFLTDLKSTNGTQISGRRITRESIWDGDDFEIGPFVFTLMVADPDEYAPDTSQIILHWYGENGAQLGEITSGPPITIGRAHSNTIALVSGKVSREHARLIQENGQWYIVDNDSTNGTFVNGEKVTRAALSLQAVIAIGEFTLRLAAPLPAQDDASSATMIASATMIFQKTQLMSPVIPIPDADATQLFSLEKTDTNLGRPPGAATPEGIPAPQRTQFPPPLFDQVELVSVNTLRELGFPLTESVYCSVGGGMGSFAWVDHLRIYGAKAEDIRVIGVEPKPYGRFRRLAEQSQVPDWERLRSPSDACPDNLWGLPSYATREMGRSLKKGQLKQVFRIGWQIFAEPDFAQTYSPVAGEVFAAVDREAERIGYEAMWTFGRVRSIRKTDDGRFVVAYSQTGGEEGRVHCLHIARVLHLAVGYPAIRFLPDLQAYREQTSDFLRVVNAFEAHDHVYEKLIANGGTVLVRGRGDVASRVIQRLDEARKKNPQIRILHLMRAPVFKGARYGRAKRKVQNHWEYQPFEWPRATWGGEYRALLMAADPGERDRLLNDWGGTTTSHRPDWKAAVNRGLAEGWYEIQFGHVARVEQDAATGKLATIIRGKTAIQGASQLLADYIIDATGLEATLDNNPLLKDMVAHYKLPRNVKNRLDVDENFEVGKMQNGEGRLFATGSITLGSPFAPVDSFLGLQYAAQRSADRLVEAGEPGLRKMGMLHSFGQWLRWLRGVRP